MELFCGAGGMARGFTPYFSIEYAVDKAEPMVNTYRANHADTDVRLRDVRLMSGCRGDFDGIAGVIGGPPCQGSSIINTRRRNDARNSLMGEYIDPRNGLMGEFMRLVEEVRPRFFVMENVPQVSKDKKNSVISRGKNAGYTVVSSYLNAADYGAAQTRRRWIVVGIRGKKWVAPAPRTPRTVRQAFAPLNGNWGLMHCTEKTLGTLAGSTGEWTAMSGKFKNMIKLSWDRPSPAVVNLKKVYMVHPGENRNISLAEAAALQGFPPGYVWRGTESEVAQMIANAMPSEMAGGIAETICIEGV